MKLLTDKPADDELIWHDFMVNPTTGQEWEIDDSGKPVKTEGLEPETISFGLKFLKGHELNEIHKAVYTMQTRYERAGKRRSRRTMLSEFDYSGLVEMRLEAAIVKWKGVTDEKSKVVPPSRENIQRLPAWLHERLGEIIDDMNGLGVELEEE